MVNRTKTFVRVALRFPQTLLTPPLPSTAIPSPTDPAALSEQFSNNVLLLERRIVVICLEIDGLAFSQNWDNFQGKKPCLPFTLKRKKKPVSINKSIVAFRDGGGGLGRERKRRERKEGKQTGALS